MTTLSLPFVPLAQGGRPPRDGAAADADRRRAANGEVMTLCTAPQTHHGRGSDRQRGRAQGQAQPPAAAAARGVAARQSSWSTGRSVALVVAVLLGWLIHRWLSRPKRGAAAPPPGPALARGARELDQIRGSSLLADRIAPTSTSIASTTACASTSARATASTAWSRRPRSCARCSRRVRPQPSGARAHLRLPRGQRSHQVRRSHP